MKTRVRRTALAYALGTMLASLMVAGLSGAIAATPAADIECRISMPARVASKTSIPLTFELVNRNKRAAYNVLNWDTPLEGFYGHYLSISGPGGDVEYRGTVVKRAATPTREEYVNIKSGGRIARTVNLAPAYDFKSGGRYQVTFTGKLIDATREKIPRALEYRTELAVECPVVTFELAAGR